MIRACGGLIRACGGLAGCLGAAIVLTLGAMALLAPLVAPFDPLAVSIPDQLLEPDARFLFGTDQSGRDVLSRVIWASRASLGVAGCAVIIGLLGGVSLGLAAGFHRGGWFEQAVMRWMPSPPSRC